MEKKLNYLFDKFNNPAYSSICPQAEFNRKEFVRLCDILGETFFDYIGRVIVHHELDGAAVTLSQHALEELRKNENDLV